MNKPLERIEDKFRKGRSVAGRIGKNSFCS